MVCLFSADEKLSFRDAMERNVPHNSAESGILKTPFVSITEVYLFMS